MVVLRSGRNLVSGSSLSSESKHGPSTEKSIPGDCYSRARAYEASKWSVATGKEGMQYVIEALKFYNKLYHQNYKLVEAGGMTPEIMPSCTIFHINFTAKIAEIAHAPTQMFFAEFIRLMGKALSVSLCECLGTINSLSGEKLNGCHFCGKFNNVWHPEGGGFVRGGEYLFKTVEDICGIDSNNYAILDEKNNLPMLKHVNHAPGPKKEGEYTTEQVADARPYATEAVTFYNRSTHSNYELVELGFITRVFLPTCSLLHMNFTAKKTDVKFSKKKKKKADVAVAPEMFFAELTDNGGVLSFNLCKCMGPTGSISGDKLRGCYYCRKYNNVQHPRGGGFVRGGDSLFKKTPY